MTKPSLSCRIEREGTVRALGDTGRRATSEHAGRPDGSSPLPDANEIRPSGRKSGWYRGVVWIRFAPEPTGAERFIFALTQVSAKGALV